MAVKGLPETVWPEFGLQHSATAHQPPVAVVWGQPQLELLLGLRDGSRLLTVSPPGRAMHSHQPSLLHPWCLHPGNCSSEGELRCGSGAEQVEQREPCPTKGSRPAVSRAPGSPSTAGQAAGGTLNIHNCVIRGCQCIAAGLGCPLPCPSRGTEGPVGCWQDCTSKFLPWEV